MSLEYWPWWIGGPALALVALLFPLLTRTPFGVSGSLARLLRWRAEAGAPPRASMSPSSGCAPTSTATPVGCGPTPPAATPGRPASDRFANLVFLLAIAMGGALAGRVEGRPWFSTSYSPDFHQLFGFGSVGLLVLFGGGVLVGFGTRLSGGCTSGHGLSGCGRLQPASLVATAVFFGVAIGVSFLLEAPRP